MAEAKKKSAPGNITVIKVPEEKQFSWDDLTQEEIEQEQQKRLEAKRKAAE